jgi:signal transduction histidine kinase
MLGFRSLRFVLGADSTWADTISSELAGLSEPDLEQACIAIQQLRLGVSSVAFVEWYVMKDGDIKAYRARLAVAPEAVAGADGGAEEGEGVFELFGVSEEITEQVRMEKLQRQRLSTVEGVLRSLPDAVVVVQSGVIKLANEQARRLLGPLVAEGSPFLGIAEEDLRKRLAEHGRPGNVAAPTVIRLRGDAERYVEVTSSDLEADELARTLVFRDVTRRLRAEHRAEAAERLASVGQLAAGIAHEINNPLAFVSMNLEMLAEDLNSLGLPPPVQTDLKGRMNDALLGTRRITEIVSQLRIYANARSVSNRSGRVREAVELAIQLTSLSKDTKVSIVNRVPEELPKVRMAVGPLSQVFINLFMNANDAIVTDGPDDGRVVISTSVSDGFIQVFIQDNGPGIPKSSKRRIFEPYFTTKEPGKGTGMGLSIVRSLVHRAGGAISLREVRYGTCFEVHLPLADGTELDEEITSRQPVKDDADQLRRMLIIDDESMLLRVLARRLSNQYEVRTASDGIEAKEILESGFVPHAILCDIVMPRMDGREFYEWLGTFDQRLQGRVILMTGGTLSADRADFIRDESRTVLSKPLSFESIEQSIEALED